MTDSVNIGTKKIFVASPSDVITERNSMAQIINELNYTLTELVPDTGIVLELVRWETHAYPAMGRPQGVVNNQIGPYDIFVGILWQRFGTPTGKAESGTEEEFRRAYEMWSKTGAPHILFYFNTEPITPPKSIEASEQLNKVVKFRTELTEKGLLWEYDGASQFADIIRPHLVKVVGEIIRSTKAIKKAHRTTDIGSTVPSLVQYFQNRELSGTAVRIINVDPSDAYYINIEDLIGRTGKLREPFPEEREEGWYSGLIDLDYPPEGYAPTFNFYRVQIERI